MPPPTLDEPRCPFPEKLADFVASTDWRYAKTYAATWPHYYVVRRPENDLQLVALATHIDRCGEPGWFYAQRRKYHHEAGWVYWYMEDRPEDALLVNRCLKAQTYEARARAGTLPRSQSEG
jgi:hypothetical protein